MRGAAAGNALTIDSPTLDILRSIEVRPAVGSVDFYTEDTVYTRDRVPIPVDDLSLTALEERMDNGLVAVNSRNEYHDLGTITATEGRHALRFDKLDNNPLLVEGVVLIPEDEYQRLDETSTSTIITSPDELECGTTYDVFGPDSEGYVDPQPTKPRPTSLKKSC
jgi:hypothetical protein